MKIKYTKKRLRVNLILGLIWLVLGVLKWGFDHFDFWLDYYPLVLAFLYLALYLFELQNQYLNIVEDLIKKNYPFGKQIHLPDVTRIKKYAGDYILLTDKSKMKIDTQIIDPDCLKKLKRVLADLNLSPDKTPFTTSVQYTSLSKS
ncbi:hypothetical protein SAMN06265375_10150 [Muriicola jejuensis]|uniref:PH domain-containing protein n=1 Tax=Muriicola jejuensis TaxID=504488 RepID=A0A6P0UB05_9FLAO|nr:hypothetical protein [Muriicola jejuensis]NER10405.1 hypothetical protein [Muriicola jejuensis]SMP00932.1 hypothetical protein SAMN06265375_10150 [Muriicola jejuensis]